MPNNNDDFSWLELWGLDRPRWQNEELAGETGVEGGAATAAGETIQHVRIPAFHPPREAILNLPPVPP